MIQHLKNWFEYGNKVLYGHNCEKVRESCVVARWVRSALLPAVLLDLLVVPL